MLCQNCFMFKRLPHHSEGRLSHRTQTYTFLHQASLTSKKKIKPKKFAASVSVPWFTGSVKNKCVFVFVRCDNRPSHCNKMQRIARRYTCTNENYQKKTIPMSEWLHFMNLKQKHMPKDMYAILNVNIWHNRHLFNTFTIKTHRTGERVCEN